MSTIFEQFTFLLTIIGIFFLPGAMFLAAFLRKKLSKFSVFEFVFLSFAAGLSLLDFGMLLLSKFSVPLSQISVLGLAAILIGVPFSFSLPFFRNILKQARKKEPIFHSVGFSKKEGVLFSGILILTLLMKSAFLWDAILPTATDLGHHMYWAKKIAVTGTVPAYRKISVVSDENDTISLTEPRPIDDFIIGEHLPFAAISLAAGLNLVSATPSLFLLMINILTLLSIAFLAYRLFEDLFPTKTIARGGTMAVLLVIGPLWALSSPEAKYVSGGVVGNLFGNFLIPVILLSFFRAFREKDGSFLALALLFSGTLAFTHHLSTLVFLFIAAFIGVLIPFLIHKDSFPELREWLRLFRSPAPVFIVFSLIAITLFVYTPTYLQGKSIDTAIGTPSKSTREGLTFDQLAQSAGGVRLGLELLGVALILASPLRKKLSGIVLIAWSAGLLCMALFPEILFLNIPSNRISTYGTFPAAVLSGFAFATLFMQRRTEKNSAGANTDRLLRWPFAIFFITTIVSGFFDNATSLPVESNAAKAVQTYAVSSWLAKNTPPNEWVLKDHNYIVADSWIKLSFMKDYSYPLSRGAFQRYNDETKPREQCTLLMISAPNTPKAKACFDGTGTTTVAVNPHVDSAQFAKNKDMSLIYLSDDIAVYKETSNK